MVDFSRQLGSESGVQLNPLQSTSDGLPQNKDDQVFAIPMRTVRGRIDKPFLISVDNFKRKLGYGESIRSNDLNEAMSQTYHALNSGSKQCLVYRLHTDEAELKYIIATVDGSGFSFEVANDIPNTPFAFAIKHMECFNDGIKIAIHAEVESDDNGDDIDNSVITLTVYDNSGETKLFSYTGSLDPLAVDSAQNSYYLPDLVENQTDLLQVEIGATFKALSKSSDAYGLDNNGYEKEIISDTLIYFTEGGTGYSTANYQAARTALRKARESYGFITIGGSQSVALISAMIDLMYDVNRQFRWDVSGKLSPAAAIAFIKQFSVRNEANHLFQVFWKPVKNRDPLGVSPKYHIGGSALNIAFACAKNAITNSKGFSKKQAPVAGVEFPINFTGMEQTYFPEASELSALAKAGINPIVFEQYSSGGKFVFRDSLTGDTDSLSPKKLISIVDMSTTIDEWITRKAKELLQRPMDEAIQMMNDFLIILFEGAQEAKWLRLPNGATGTPFEFSVTASEQSPLDTMDIRYNLVYQGVARQVLATQSISKS